MPKSARGCFSLFNGGVAILRSGVARGASGGICADAGEGLRMYCMAARVIVIAAR